jgi:hypothetical protein
MEIDDKHNIRLVLKYPCKSTITNVVMVQNLEVISDKFSADKIRF